MWKFGLALLYFVCLANATHYTASAVLRNPANGIDGLITFEETDDGILINGNITGLKPGPHGFHVHEKGDISDPKCTSAGGHFNPFNKTHGKRDEEDRHVGDLGNIDADDKGNAIFTFIDKKISFSNVTNVIGRAIVVHAGQDDFGRGKNDDSLITGNAGARLACGVIEKNSATLGQQTSIFLSSFLVLLIFISF